MTANVQRIRMRLLSEESVHCPFCGEAITVLVDLSAGDQEYVEDCEVCCRPLALSITITGDESAQVFAQNEND